jgi:hypothetical protein
MPPEAWYSDTDPKALEVFIGLQRRMTASEKVNAVFEMQRLIWNTAELGERKRHPSAGDREIFLRLAARHLDKETMLRVYGWYPPDRF